MELPAVVRKQLKFLQDQISVLHSAEKLSLKELTQDVMRWNGVLHILQVSIECVADICGELLSAQKKDVPDAYREVIRQAGRSNIIPLEFAERISVMAGFRNIVVHNYLTLDPEKVDGIMKNHLSDFDDFIAYIYDYLRREGYIKDETQNE